MKYNIKSACSSNMGKIRTNNEDNFLFDGKSLEMYNEGIKTILAKEDNTKNIICYGVFDGMGGESNGEKASFYAANILKEEVKKLEEIAKNPRAFLEQTCYKMNDVICKQAEEDKTFMGTTAAILYAYLDDVYICNIGDSKIYRLRKNTLLQISEDHVEDTPSLSTKPALTQNLGIPEEEMQIEPFVAKGRLKKGDKFLICSDGLTDMVSEEKIYHILKKSDDVQECVKVLINMALENGGKDNITIIVCAVE